MNGQLSDTPLKHPDEKPPESAYCSPSHQLSASAGGDFWRGYQTGSGGWEGLRTCGLEMNVGDGDTQTDEGGGDIVTCLFQIVHMAFSDF